MPIIFVKILRYSSKWLFKTFGEVFVNRNVNIDNFSTYVIKGKKNLNNTKDQRVYDLSFKMWYDTWDSTYRNDFLSNDLLMSDEFTRQDEILSLFYLGECAALCFFSHVSMKDESARLDSYFSKWPKNAIDGLCSKGSEIIICSQFTVAEKFRKLGPLEMENVPWKVILMGMLSKYYMNSGRDAMTGTMRASKNMGNLTYQFGTIPLKEKHIYREATDRLPVDLVDLVGFYQDNVHNAYYSQPLSKFLDELWENRNSRHFKIAA